MLKTAVHPKATWSACKRNSIMDCSYSICSFHILLLSTEICVLLAHNTGHLWTYASHVQGLTYRCEGKNPSTGGNLISTALERVGSLPWLCIKIPQCHHFDALVYTPVTWLPVYLEWHSCARCSAPSSSTIRKGY